MTAITSSQVLETLYRARATLSDPDEPYEFMDFNRCTCGHVYAAVHGAFGTRGGQASQNHDSLYVAALEAVAAISEADRGDHEDPRQYVSYATVVRAGSQTDARSAALALVNDAIAKIEAEHETDRLDVLAQTRRIVDNAVPADEPVPVVA